MREIAVVGVSTGNERSGKFVKAFTEVVAAI
jgi:hypothetical protein